VFSGYQELSEAEQQETLLNIGGLGWISDHYYPNNSGNERNEASQEAMEFSLIPAAMAAVEGDETWTSAIGMATVQGFGRRVPLRKRL